MSTKPLIYDLKREEITKQLKSWGEPTYRSTQVWKGLYQNLWNSPMDFTPIPRVLRDQLGEHFTFSHLYPAKKSQSSDGQTVKTLFHLPDKQAIEAVLMSYEHRRTLCISSQAGCAMGCVFCATGQMGFKRHLSSGEIVEQVLYYARQLSKKGETITNIVLMGMGEPFHNYDAVMQAIERLNDPEGLNLGARRFTISTVGLVPAIRRFANENSQVNLAISLHATEDDLRASMLPIATRYPIPELIDACRDYTEKTRRRISFEWALIQDVNDKPEQAKKLADLLEGLLCHVNLIPLNPTESYQGQRSNQKRVEAFHHILEARGIPCTVRVRRGIDIQAGCGQLASKS
jgi:23S rRNA (adenine2503-C2)-methyltransferase